MILCQAKKELMKWFKPLESYALIDGSSRIEEIKLLFEI